MIYLFESQYDLAQRGGGVMSWDGDQEEMWGDVNPNNISGADIADIIDMIGRPASAEVAAAEYEEYRDEREDSSRLADRYGCWCNNTARDLTCAPVYTAQHITCVCTRSTRSKYTAHTQCITQHISCITQYIMHTTQHIRTHTTIHCEGCSPRSVF